MSEPLRSTGSGLCRLVWGAVLVLAVALSSCNDPQAPQIESKDYRATYDAGRGTLEFKLQSADGTISPLRLIADQITYNTETHQVHAWVALLNTAAGAMPGPDEIVVSDFSPTGVWPVNAVCTDCAAGMPPAECAPGCAFDHRGTYGEDGWLAAGETSQAVEWILSNPAGESFAFRARLGDTTTPGNGMISGVVFNDANRDGRRDPGEIGYVGAMVTLSRGDSLQITRTNARGFYAFQVMEAGLYELIWDPSSTPVCDPILGMPCVACQPTTPTRLQVAILQRPDGSLSSFNEGDFGCAGTEPPFGILVQGHVYNDMNGNGQPDPNEPGLANVMIIGAATQCPTFAPIQTRTDARGNYSLHLPDCQPPYVIQHQGLFGYTHTTPNPLVFNEPPPVGGVLRADFGLMAEQVSVYDVEGFVFLDTNRNGVREAGEGGVAGVELTVSGLVCMTPISAVAHTDEQGHYRIAGADVHCPLPWILMRHGPWGDTTPNPVTLFDPPPDDGVFRVDFGVAPGDSVPPTGTLSIQGFVYADWDRDGMRSSNEPGIANVEVQLLSPCDVLRLVRTDARGFYVFEPEVVAACPVTAVWQSRPGFPVRTTPNPVPVGWNTSPGPVLSIDFGVVPVRTNP